MEAQAYITFSSTLSKQIRRVIVKLKHFIVGTVLLHTCKPHWHSLNFSAQMFHSCLTNHFMNELSFMVINESEIVDTRKL